VVTRCRLALALVLACLAGTPGSAWAASFECRIAQSSVWRTVPEDLAARFPAAVGECRPAAAPAPAAASSAPPAPPGRLPAAPLTGPEVRVVTSRWAQPPALAWQPQDKWWDFIASAAERHGVDERLVHAVIQVESNYAANARSPKGAIGLMQLMPATAARFGAASADTLFDPRVNVDIGVRLLRDLLDRFGRTDLALAAYNAGEGAVMRHGYQIPPYRETQDYVRKVRGLYEGRPL
jgi:soluble lytic murein transglycosylase-like protein